jgi:hypothetical protein
MPAFQCYQKATPLFQRSQVAVSTGSFGSEGPVHHGGHGNSAVYHLDLITQNLNRSAVLTTGPTNIKVAVAPTM